MCIRVAPPVLPAVNGFGLALVIPCVSSIVADYNPADTRGSAFGIMSFTGGSCRTSLWVRTRRLLDAACMHTRAWMGRRSAGPMRRPTHGHMAWQGKAMRHSAQLPHMDSPAYPTYPAAASLGGMAGAFYATNVGATRPFGIEGWRFAFLLVRWLGERGDHAHAMASLLRMCLLLSSSPAKWPHTCPLSRSPFAR